MNAYIVTFAFICTDYITGLCKAGATHSFSSKIMREGLWHKLALLMAMVVGYLADYAQTIIDLGMKAPVGAAVCVYICLMELVSASARTDRSYVTANYTGITGATETLTGYFSSPAYTVVRGGMVENLTVELIEQ